MNDHNLDDLIIDGVEPKNKKTKTFLTIAALLITILIAAIVLTKIILKDPDNKQDMLIDDDTVLIGSDSPELTLQDKSEEKQAQKETELSTITESEPKAPTAIPEVLKEELGNTEESIKTTKQVIKNIEDAIKNAEKTTKIEKEIKKEEAVKEIIDPKPENKQVKTNVKKDARSINIEVADRANERPSGRPVNVPNEQSNSAKEYYIQVGLFTKQPSVHFLDVIKNSGFDYIITPKTSSGAKKLLIGPYKNRKSVDTALIKVRDRIHKSAFVVKK